MKQLASAFNQLLAVGLLTLLPAQASAQGFIRTWGNDYGLGVVTDTPTEGGFTQVAGGQSFGVGLRADGSIAVWGEDAYEIISRAPIDSGFIHVAAGLHHALALRADGSIVGWGSDTGQQVSATLTDTGFTQLTAGKWFSAGLKSDGSIVVWGSDGSGIITNTPVETGFTQITAGGFHLVALRADGSLVAWGGNSSNQVSTTPTGAGFTTLSGGYWHTVATRLDGAVTTWGSDSYDQVSSTPLGNGFVEVAASYINSVALRTDGSMVIWGHLNDPQVILLPEGPGFSSISGGHEHIMAIRGEMGDNLGNAYCFGDGSGTPCVCSQHSPEGTGCLNSTGTGARLFGGGNASVSANTFALTVVDVPPMKPGIFFQGTNQLSTPAGDGLLCSNSTHRYGSKFASVYGATDGFGLEAHAVAGQALNYQFWYRDSTNTCAGSGFNFSNAWTVTWLP
jgi:hypothetical protein